MNWKFHGELKNAIISYGFITRSWLKMRSFANFKLAFFGYLIQFTKPNGFFYGANSLSCFRRSNMSVPWPIRFVEKNGHFDCLYANRDFRGKTVT